MTIRQLLLALALVLLVKTACAITIEIDYEGALKSGALLPGLVDTESGWIESDGFDVDFWSFLGLAGQSVTISGARQNPELELGFSLYQGVITPGTLRFEFVNDFDFDDVIFLTSVSGGGGIDPILNSFVLPETGSYTIAIGGAEPAFLASGAPGPFSYQIGVTAVPIPASIWLFTPIALGLLAQFSRRMR